MNINVFSQYTESMNIQEFTNLIQNDIDLCSDNGGGCVNFDRPGIYFINGIKIKNNVDLHLEIGVILKGSGNEAEYNHRPGPFELIKNNTPISSLFYGKDCNHVSISGSGVIDGNYSQFIPSGQKKEQHLKFYKYPRPMVIYFENCNEVNIDQISILNAPFWTIHLVGCRNVFLARLKIENEVRMPNTDGIDIDRCKNVHISNCKIVTGDDGVCLKCTEETSKYGNCTNVYVSNCHIGSQSSAIKFGSSSFGNFENCYFENLTIEDSNRGLTFQLRDPGNAYNIFFKHISISTKRFSKEWWGSGEPISITLFPRDSSTDISRNFINNVIFSDINCESDNGILINSEKSSQIKNIIFNNIDLIFRQPLSTEIEFDLRPCENKEKLYSRLKGLTSNGTQIIKNGFRVQEKL